MAIQFNISEIDNDLLEFREDLSDIDMERVKESTLRRVAEEMRDMVRLAIRQEDDITSPADLNSKYTGGPGPPMSQEAAWNVEKNGSDTYIVAPNPKVRQRAMVLNYGYPGMIRPTSGEALKFEVDGSTVFASEVEGPDPTHYWRAAREMLENSGKLEEIASEELEEEVEVAFR